MNTAFIAIVAYFIGMVVTTMIMLSFTTNETVIFFVGQVAGLSSAFTVIYLINKDTIQ